MSKCFANSCYDRNNNMSLSDTGKYEELHVQNVDLSEFYSLSVKLVPIWMNKELISCEELRKDTNEALPKELVLVFSFLL